MATMVGTRLESLPGVEVGVAVLRAGAAMDLGQREDQEDALGLVQPGADPDAGRGSLFVLADGLGGHVAGELASRLAVAQIVQDYYAAPAHQPGNRLQSAIAAAHSRVRVAAATPGRKGMGTTCVCAAVQGDRLWVANVGDSRAYLVRPSEGVLQLTQDHSLVAEQLRQGLITPEAAAVSPMRSVLLQSLGTATPPQPYFAPPLRLHRGDLVLLCSDGLYGALDTPALRDYLLAALASMREVQPDLLARDLLAAALFHGADDNLSALVICCTDVLVPTVARLQAPPPARRVFLPVAPEPDLTDALPPEELPALEATTDRALWDLDAAQPSAPDPQPPTSTLPSPTSALQLPTLPNPQPRPTRNPQPPPLPLDLTAAPLLRYPAVHRPAPLRTTRLLGALGLVGLGLLAGGVMIAPFSAPWIVLLLGLVGIAGLLVFVIAFWSPIGDLALVRPGLPGDAAQIAPAERGLGAVESAGVPSTRTLTADLLGRLLPGTAAPRLATGRPADRALPAPPGVPTPPAPPTAAAPEAAAPSYVNQAFSEALARARHQWTFNLLVAFGTAGLVIVGIAVSVTWVLGGQANIWALLLGPGATLIGVVNWLLTRPAAQLSHADNQISLLTLVWTSYAQELRSCAAMPDPAAAAACTGHAGADAVNYFNTILSHPAELPPT